MAKHAVIDAGGKVTNVVEIEPGSGWAPPAGCSIVWSATCGTAQVGGTWNGSSFSPPGAAPSDPLAADVNRCRDYVASAQIDAYLANATPSTAETAAALKETCRALRSLIRIVRGAT